jgi:hypothetical protein
MAVRLVQAQTSALATSVPYVSNVTKGSLLVLAVSDVSEQLTSVTDLLGNTWTQASKSVVNGYVAIYYAVSRAAGPNTVTANNGGVGTEMWVWEVGAGQVSRASMPPVVVADGHSTGAGPGATATPGAVTPSHPSVFVVSSVRTNGGQSVSSGAAGWAFDQTSATKAVEWLLTAGMTAQTGSFTLSSSDNYDAVCVSLAFPMPDASAVLQPKMKPFLV